MDEEVKQYSSSLASEYFQAKHPLLSKEEEADLCRRAQAGDKDASDRMVICNLRLAMSIAKRYHTKSMSREDLIQEGTVGLLEAIRRFDAAKGCRFSTYATWWVRQSITRAVNRTDRMVRLPTYGYEVERKVAEARLQLEIELGRDPTAAEIADATGFSQTIIRGLEMFGVEPLSLDLLIGEETDMAFIDAIPDLEAVDPLTEFMKQETGQELRHIMEILPERERKVLERRFGFYDGKIWTLRDISIEMHYSREAIRNIEKRALFILREYFKHNPELKCNFTEEDNDEGGGLS